MQQTVEEQLATIAQGQLEAYNAHDIERFLSFYADDFTFFNFPDEVRMQGKGVAREAYARLFMANPNLSAHVSARIVRPPCVIDHEHLTGHASRPDGTNGFVIYEIKAGLITRLWSGAWSDRP